MVWFNAIGAGSPTSIILKDVTSDTTRSQTGTGSATGNTGATGQTGQTGNGSAGTAAGADDTDTSTTANAAKTESNAQALQDRFLTLLVAQMRNQDPLNPLENAEVTTQMAQISTVEGIAKMNTTMASISSATGMNRASASTGLIGQDVFVPGSGLSWDGETGSMRSGVTLSDAASQVTVQLFDASGKVVDQQTFTDQAAGTISLDWTGRGPNGTTYGAGDYTMRATVMSDSKATATTLTTARVTGVVDSADGVVAMLATGERIAISKINGVFQSRTGTSDKSQA